MKHRLCRLESAISQGPATTTIIGMAAWEHGEAAPGPGTRKWN
jgi:hypothetical protein